MNTLAFLYPGQGSQSVGMGVAVFEAFDEAKNIFDNASNLAGYDMLAFCAEGPAEKLSKTLYTQPALFTVEAALTEVLKAQGLKPSLAAGHSLGEYSALYAAGVFSFEDGFRLVSERGRLMSGLDPEGRGTMAAVIGLDYDTVKMVCGSVQGTVVVANINSPQQVVISGEKGAVAHACGILTNEHGAKRVMPLNVSGAFHSPFMAGVQERLSSFIEKITLSDAEIPVYSNVTAAPVTRADEIRENMVLQLTSPVRWTEIVRSIVESGVREAYEVGPGNVLAGLIKRTDERLNVKPAGDYQTLMEAVHEKA